MELNILFELQETAHAHGSLIRGLGVTTSVAVLTVWAILRSRRTSSALDLEDATSGEPLVQVARWFVRMRWLACSISLILVFFTIDIAGLLQPELLDSLLGCIGVLVVSNLVFSRLLKHRQHLVDGLVKTQVVTDLILLTALLHYSGGIENPLSMLYIFHVIIAGILFDRSRCYYAAFISLALFAALAVIELRGWLPHYTLEIFPHDEHAEAGGHAAHVLLFVVSRILLQALLLLTTAYFITTIMDRLRAREQQTRIHAQREAEARAQLESVVHASGAGLRLLDADLEPVWTNERFREWSLADSRALRAAKRTLQDGETRITEHDISETDGRRRFFSMTTAALRRQGQPVHQVVQLVQDVTERREIQAQVLHTEKLAAVGELAASVAHEVNNPLGVLSARLKLIQARPDISPEKLATDVGTMVGLSDRIADIMRKLLGYCRPAPRDLGPVLAPPTLQRVQVLADLRAAKKSIQVEFHIDPDLPPILGVQGEIEQILVNLVGNAIDASPTGSRVEVRAHEEVDQELGRCLCLMVDDCGPGIPEELRARVLEPFYSTKKTGEGTGLGLAICQRIVRDHKGLLRISDSPLGGARLVVLIPSIPLET